MNYFIYEHSDDPRKQELKHAIKSQIQTIVTDPTQADLILVLGGDGTMIDAIHRFHELKKPFFGVNCGTVGFLLNEIQSPEEIPHNLDDLEFISESFLEATFRTKNEILSTAKAVNDILISEDLRNFPTFSITKGDKKIGPIKGSGLLLSSALGSSGYWANGMGPMIPTGTNRIGVMGVFARPYDFSITSGDGPMHIDILSREPIDAHIDGRYETFHDVTSLTVHYSKELFSLGFIKTPHDSFHNKRLNLFTTKFQHSL